jgi:MFS family permease
MKLTMNDPPRLRAQGTAEVLDLDGVVPVLKRLVTSWAIINLVLGFTLASFAYGANAAFAQPYFIRAFGLTVGQIGLIFGLSGGLAGAGCLIFSGRFTDWATPLDERWHTWLPVMGMGLSLPCILGAYTVGDWRIAVGLTFLAGFSMNWFIIPSLSIMHKLLGVRRVATGMTLILMFQNVLGLGAGPYVAGLVIDGLANRLFGPSVGGFAIACRGGKAMLGAAPELALKCHTALTSATRLGLLSNVAILVWACIHYGIASRFLRSGAPIRTIMHSV